HPDVVVLVTRRATEGRTPHSGQGLYVEDLLDPVGELQGRDGVAGAQLDHADATLELVVVRRDRRTTERGGLADPGQTHEREIAVERQPTRVPGDRGDHLASAGLHVDALEPSEAGVEDVEGSVVPAG